jgi:hypothetical protein
LQAPATQHSIFSVVLPKGGPLFLIAVLIES